jgi:hypothetical protein
VKGKWTPAIALVLMLAAFLPPLLWRLQAQQLRDLIIAPAWERRVLALAILLPLIPATALIVAAVRRTLRLTVVLPLVALVVLGLAGGAALMTVLTENFIFGDRYLRTEAGGPEELHVYDSSFLTCSVKVYAAQPGALYAREVVSENIACDRKETVRPVWSDGGVVLIGGGVADTPSLFFGPR